jgi:hypothetical protein
MSLFPWLVPFSTNLRRFRYRRLKSKMTHLINTSIDSAFFVETISLVLAFSFWSHEEIILVIIKFSRKHIVFANSITSFKDHLTANVFRQGSYKKILSEGKSLGNKTRD